MPIVTGIGGNSGNQTSTLIVRGRALDQVSAANARRLLAKELGISPSYPYYKGYYYRYPTFSIVSVSRNSSVTIQTYNLPPNDTFDVTMGPMGTQGIGGCYVDTVNSGSGGSKKYTFTIPSALRGSYQISIRMHSPYSGFFAYNWFYNNTTPQLL